MQMQEALDRCEYAIKCQRTEIDRLRAVVKRQEEELTQLLAWIDGDSDALVVLQRESPHRDPGFVLRQSCRSGSSRSPWKLSA
jgi:hypothetical protein